MKKSSMYLMILGLSLALLSGCQTKAADTPPTLAKADQALVWQAEREKPFGYYDYKELADEKELTTLLTDKFELSLPKSYQTFQTLISQAAYFQGMEKQGQAYEIISSGEQVIVHTQTQYGTAEQVDVTADLTLTYKFSAEEKQAYLYQQTIVLNDGTAGQMSQFYDSLEEICTTVAKPLGFGEVEGAVQTFKNKHAGADKALVKQTLSITDNTAEMKKEKGLQKSIQVYYDTDGVLRTVFIDLIDLTK